MDIRKSIKKEMEKQGLNISELSRGAFVDRGQLSKFLIGAKNMGSNNLQGILNYLGMEFK